MVELKNNLIAELAEPLGDLITQVLPGFLNDNYDLLVVEGISARVPGLVFTGVVDRFRRDHEQPPIDTWWLGRETTRIGRSLNIPEAFNPHSRLLILTEYMRYGFHASDLVKRLQEVSSFLGIDVATVFAVYDAQRYAKVLPWDTGYYYGYQWPAGQIARIEMLGDVCGNTDDRLPQPAIYGQDWLNVDSWKYLKGEEEFSPRWHRPELLIIKQDLSNLTDWITNCVNDKVKARI
ncbi:hypothetical protein M1563_00535 [Patescibacteria group bacterium]|nr:hypothetical protein [Patescibacteria group bacterium]MCL5409386.1 hypothetical protein [Patescibacteria group bacterium]